MFLKYDLNVLFQGLEVFFASSQHKVQSGQGTLILTQVAHTVSSAPPRDQSLVWPAPSVPLITVTLLSSLPAIHTQRKTWIWQNDWQVMESQPVPKDVGTVSLEEAKIH